MTAESLVAVELWVSDYLGSNTQWILTLCPPQYTAQWRTCSSVSWSSCVSLSWLCWTWCWSQSYTSVSPWVLGGRGRRLNSMTGGWGDGGTPPLQGLSWLKARRRKSVLANFFIWFSLCKIYNISKFCWESTEKQPF